MLHPGSLTQHRQLSLSFAAEHSPSELALITDERSFTFAELSEKMLAFRKIMATSLGVSWAEALPIRANNTLSTLLALYAVIESQGSVIALHPRLSDHETQALLSDFTPRDWLDDDRLQMMAQHAERRTASRMSLLPPAESLGLSDEQRAAPVAYLFTSGTTGKPKAAILSRRAFIASALASERNLQWESHDRWLLCLPVCHVGGLSIVMRCLLAQKPVRLLRSFDEHRLLECILRDECTLLSVVPTMLRRLLAVDRDNVLAKLRVVLVGGAATPEALVDECAVRKIALRTTYGMTEACSQITTQNARPRDRAEYGYGPTIDGAEIEIRNEAGSLCAVDEVGRIRVRGPMLFSGYVGYTPQLPEQWFDTNDLGSFNSRGNLQVFSRRTELIITGGENVYPLEVERELERCTDVKAVMVFALDDPEWGHKVACALVVGEGFSLEQFRHESRLRLSAHKRPRAYAIVDALPVNAAGKLDRHAATRTLTDKMRPL